MSSMMRDTCLSFSIDIPDSIGPMDLQIMFSVGFVTDMPVRWTLGLFLASSYNRLARPTDLKKYCFVGFLQS